MSDFQRNRELLGIRLRELRRSARLTGIQLAGELGWRQSKVSRLECGRQTASRDDVTAWVDATDAHPDLVGDLMSLLINIESDYAAWRREFRVGTRRKQLNLLRLEARTTTFRGFETCVVPGLFQTAAYAAQRLGEMPDLHGAPNDVQAAVAARMQRQQVLYDSAKRFHFVLSEAVLRTRLCPPDVMRGQLDRLITAAGLPNVRVGVLPFSARFPIAPLNGFWIFDERLVTFETIAAEIHIRDPDEIAAYVDSFDRPAGAATYDLRAFIEA